jgi:hypothetical protein
LLVVLFVLFFLPLLLRAPFPLLLPASHACSLSGLSGFELVAGFPPKPLTDPSLTLKEAGLLNGSITQRGG